MIDLLGFAQTPFVRGLDAELCATGSECNPRVIGRAGLVLDDLDLVVTHDCFTNADRMRYEAMGLTPPGAGARALDQGWVMPGGRLPANLSGGLKAKGHSIGATGVSMHLLAPWQLLGRWRSAEPGRSRLAGVFNMGGAGMANYGPVLERMA